MAHKTTRASETENLTLRAQAYLKSQELKRDYYDSESFGDLLFGVHNGERRAILDYNRDRILQAHKRLMACFVANDHEGVKKAALTIHFILTGGTYEIIRNLRHPWRKRGEFHPMSYGDAVRVLDAYVPTYKDDDRSVTIAAAACSEVLDSIECGNWA